MTKEELILSLEKEQIFLADNDITLLEKVLSNTLETNKLFNLTAIKDENEFREKMIFDSLLPLSFIDIKDKKCLDVGTGAGFPGLLLSIVGKTHFDLLDSTKKKLDFITNEASELGIDIKCINDRCESYARRSREQYDYVFARAVSELGILIEIIFPLLKVGGAFVAYKGPNYKDEIIRAKKIMKNLDAEIIDVKEFSLPFSKETRNILLIKKKSKSLNKFPREYKVIVEQYK